ncbi:MAG: hypothetical protein ACPGJS_08520 [Flammeovirgaceae bacterium]
MKRINLYLFISCCFVFITFHSIRCQGQSATNSNQTGHWQNIVDGQHDVQSKTIISHKRAAQLYLESLDCLENGNPERAIQHIERIMYHSTYAPLKLHLYAGQAFHLNHQYYKALKHYKRYRALQLFEENQEEVDYANHLISQVQHAFELSYQPSKNKLTALHNSLAHHPLQQKYLMISPKLNEIYFAEASHTQKNKIEVYKLSPHATTELKKEKTNIRLPKKFRPLQFYHQGNALLLINVITNQLFTASYQNGEWSSPIKLKGLPHLGTVSSASISDDGTLVIYSRVFPNDDMDLYAITKTAGKWSKAKRLAINSFQQECFPNLTADGQTLYFSSARAESIGGFDIMVSQYHAETQTWSAPKNLGLPINTPYDELQFAIHPNGKSGVVLSNYRQKGEKQCLYFFEQHEPDYSLSR